MILSSYIFYIFIKFDLNKLLIEVNKFTTSMYTGFKPNTSINKSVTSGINETHLESLQREVDTYTRKLEQEKRKYFSIQDSYKSITEEYEKEKKKLNELKKQNQKAMNLKLQAYIKNLQYNLDKAISTYDDTVAYNNKLKIDIDMLRRQKKNYIEMHRSLNEQIVKLEEQSAEKVQFIQKKKSKAEELKNQIMNTKLKNEEQRESYMKQFDNLETQYMKEKRERQNKLYEKPVKVESIDTQPLLKFRLKKLLATNKEKMKSIQQYKKHMKQIEEAFNDIRQKSGIQDLNEITNTFIKSEEQNYSLYNYMDTLSQNIDTLQQTNLELETRIAKQIQQNEERKQILNGSTEQERLITQLQSYTAKREETTNELNLLIQGIRPNLEQTLLSLAKSEYNDNPKLLEDYELGFDINDRTIEQYLSDLQKFINTLLVAKQEAKTKVVTNMKDLATSYTKQLPTVNNQEVKERFDSKDQNKFLQEDRFREYAAEYWERRKNRKDEKL